MQAEKILMAAHTNIGGMKMVLTPKGQGLRLSTNGMQAKLAQPPNGNDVALFLHTSGTPFSDPIDDMARQWLAVLELNGCIIVANISLS